MNQVRVNQFWGFKITYPCKLRYLSVMGFETKGFKYWLDSVTIKKIPKLIICGGLAKMSYYEKHREERLKYKYKYNIEHPDYFKRWREENREKWLERTKEYNANVRLFYIYILGGKCEMCGETNVVLLNFHHTIPSLKIKDEGCH